MKATYWQTGNTMDYSNLGSEVIEAGSVVTLGKRIGVAGTTIEVGKVGSIHVTGVFEMAKAAEAISYGDELYYDPEEEVVTKTATDIKAGYAFELKTSDKATVLVKIG